MRRLGWGRQEEMEGNCNIKISINNNISSNNNLSFLRDSEEVSAKGRS